MLNTILMIIAIVLMIMGVASESYWISILGLLLIIGMLVLRGLHIQKLNREIKKMKEISQDEIDNTEDE